MILQDSHNEECTSLQKAIDEGKERIVQEQNAQAKCREEHLEKEATLRADIADLQTQICVLEANLGDPTAYHFQGKLQWLTMFPQCK